MFRATSRGRWGTGRAPASWNATSQIVMAIFPRVSGFEVAHRVGDFGQRDGPVNDEYES